VRVPAAGLLNVVAPLAALPKSKETYWLCVVVEDRLKRDASTSADRFNAAVETVDVVEAVRCVTAAYRAGKLSELISTLTVVPKSPLGSYVFQAALRQLKTRPTDEVDTMLLGAVVLALTEPVELPGPWPDVCPPEVYPGGLVGGVSAFNAANRAYVEQSNDGQLDWFTLDGHTAVGSRAIAQVSRTAGVRYGMLKELMFTFESIKSGPSSRPGRWEDEGFAIVARDYGWVDHETGREMWTHLKPHLREAIERLRG